MVGRSAPHNLNVFSGSKAKYSCGPYGYFQSINKEIYYRFVDLYRISQKHPHHCQYGVWCGVVCGRIEFSKHPHHCQYGVWCGLWTYRISQKHPHQYGVRVHVEQDLGSSHLRPLSLHILSSP